MHDVRISFNRFEGVHADAAGLGDASEVIARQVHQHYVLSRLFGVFEELAFQLRVLRGVSPRRRVPAMGLNTASPLLIRTMTSGDAPASTSSPIRRKNMYGEGLIILRPR